MSVYGQGEIFRLGLLNYLQLLMLCCSHREDYYVFLYKTPFTEWLDNPELKDYDECLQLGASVDRMGNSGTYIRYIMILLKKSVTRWFKPLKEYTENVFMYI